MNTGKLPGPSKIGRAIVAGVRAAVGLLVDDGAVALGVVLAVTVAAVLTTFLGPSDAVGWVLFALVWAALGVSLRRALS